MENAFVPNTQTTSPVARILNRDELASLNDLFVLDLANRGFLSDPAKHWADYNGRPLLLPLLLIALGLIAMGVVSLSGSTLAVVVVAVVFLGLIFLGITRNNHNNRMEQQGQLLQATITNVFVRERAGWANVLYGVLNVLLIIMEFIDMFSTNSNRTSYSSRYSTLGYNPGDFYEVNVEFSAATPAGGQLNGVVRKNRPDLRKGTLPTVDSAAVILYVDDSQYKLL